MQFEHGKLYLRWTTVGVGGTALHLSFFENQKSEELTQEVFWDEKDGEKGKSGALTKMDSELHYNFPNVRGEFEQVWIKKNNFWGAPNAPTLLHFSFQYS